MELPRNITQVGETDRNCKIYVEDYVVSYMRQMNRFAEQKEMTIALFGKMSVEEQITYCFVYGACAIQSISREVRHLSQAQNQEIEKSRKKYFPEQMFLGYQILNGEMIEGFRICDQNSCRYVKGYACFFEKNDTMLAYMLEARVEEAQPEMVEQDKYDMVKKRQEERRLRFENKTVSAPMKEKNENVQMQARKFKVAPFVFAATGCLVLTMAISNDMVKETAGRYLADWAGDIKEMADNKELVDIVGQPIGGEKFDDVEQPKEEQPVMSTLVAEDVLADAILEENLSATEEIVIEGVPEEIPETNVEIEMQGDAAKEEKPDSYTICPGDTLIAISTKLYGDDRAVEEICTLNHISDPDNIQIGQKILLPY